VKRQLIGSDLWIEQDPDQAFNLDTILLKDFIRVPKKTTRILDFGTGTGVLMLYVSEKTKAKITGIELQETRYQKALINIKLNALDHQLSCVLKDINSLDLNDFKDIDLIVSNPPFFKLNDQQKTNLSDEKTIARHEVAMTLEQLIMKAALCLKFGGSFQLIHRPDRLGELVSLMQKYHFEVKRIKMVHPYAHQKANHVLIEATKNGKPGVIVEPPMILYQEKHQMTDALKKLYGGV
jgi:tRNA1Val (adenine37-N6)-methyltransferase